MATPNEIGATEAVRVLIGKHGMAAVLGAIINDIHMRRRPGDGHLDELEVDLKAALYNYERRYETAGFRAQIGIYVDAVKGQLEAVVKSLKAGDPADAERWLNEATSALAEIEALVPEDEEGQG